MIRPPFQRAFLRNTIVAAPLIATAGFLWFRHINAPPTATIPAVVLPSPNAADTLLIANSQIVDCNGIDSANSWMVSGVKHEYTIAEKASIVDENARALATLRQALRQPFGNSYARQSTLKHGELVAYRSLGRLLTIDAQVRAANGDYAGSAQVALDTIALGVMIPRGSGIIYSAIGSMIQKMGEGQIWEVVDHLDPEQADAARRRLESLTSSATSFADSLREEKLSVEAVLVDELSQRTAVQAWPNNRPFLDTIHFDAHDGANVAERLRGYTVLAMRSKQQIVDHYAAALDSQIAYAERPYGIVEEPAVTAGDPVGDSLIANTSRLRLMDTSVRMDGRLLACALALRAYTVQHGAYPESLDALVTAGLLTTVPSDPFASAETVPVHYRRLSESRYLLYSVGPDGVDNGGAPIDFANKPTGLRFLQASDGGDWVAGTDRF